MSVLLLLLFTTTTSTTITSFKLPHDTSLLLLPPQTLLQRMTRIMTTGTDLFDSEGENNQVVLRSRLVTFSRKAQQNLIVKRNKVRGE